MDSQDFVKLKLLLAGSSGVGKSSLLLRYTDDTFSSSYISTIGVDFKIKNIHDDLNKPIKLQIWDTAGQERFRTIALTYYRGANGIILVYDITDKQSFLEIETIWNKQVEQGAPQDVVKVLVGNKSDLESARVVSFQQGKELADKLGMKFFETSAKTAANVDFAFLATVDLLRVKTEDSSKTTPGAAPGKISSLKTGTSFKDLYLDTSFADVIFEVENEQIHGHKNILAKNCTNSKTIKIDDVKPQTFKVFIAYLYSADDIAIDESTALELISLANKYQLPDLRTEGERALSTFLSANNFLKYVQLSETLGETFLKEAVIKFILKNYEFLKDREEIYQLPDAVMHQISQALKRK